MFDSYNYRFKQDLDFSVSLTHPNKKQAMWLSAGRVIQGETLVRVLFKRLAPNDYIKIVIFDYDLERPV